MAIFLKETHSFSIRRATEFTVGPQLGRLGSIPAGIYWLRDLGHYLVSLCLRFRIPP